MELEVTKAYLPELNSATRLIRKSPEPDQQSVHGKEYFAKSSFMFRRQLAEKHVAGKQQMQQKFKNLSLIKKTVAARSSSMEMIPKGKEILQLN